MSTAPAAAALAANSMASNSVLKTEEQAAAGQGAPQAGDGDVPHINWDSEIQLVSSLAKLQELERKVRSRSICGPQCAVVPSSPALLEIFNEVLSNYHRSMNCASLCLRGY